MIKLVALLIVVLLSACATPQNKNTQNEQVFWQQNYPKLQNINTWRMAGRLKLKTDNDSHVLSIVWIKKNQTDTISLLAPLGQTVLQLKLTPQSTRIQLSDGREIFDGNPQQTIKNLTNLDVPINQLFVWILGKTEKNLINEFDNHGRLLTSALNGWQLDISEYVTLNSAKHGELDLPSVININNGNNLLLLRIKSWNIDSTKEPIVFDDEFLSIPVFKP